MRGGRKMSSLTISQKEIKGYEKLRLMSEIAPIREHIKLFENRYGCDFEEFERKIKKEEENFKHWDDYIEWKAYLETFEELKEKFEKVEDAENIRVT